VRNQLQFEPTKGPLHLKARQVRWEFRTIVGRYPALIRLLGPHTGEVVGPQTDIVIEGFPRTANTFAVRAFRLAQPGEVRIAHHLHAPAQVVFAAKRGIPALVLIRDPEETVLSLVMRSFMSVSQALRSYIRFYRSVLPYRDRFVTGEFQRVVSDFGGIIREINGKFGTHFVEFRHTQGHLEQIMRGIDEADQRAYGVGERLERSRARPSNAKAPIKEMLRETYRAPSLDKHRRQAERLKQALI
jgi:hypothetical protein